MYCCGENSIIWDYILLRGKTNVQITGAKFEVSSKLAQKVTPSLHQEVTATLRRKWWQNSAETTVQEIEILQNLSTFRSLVLSKMIGSMLIFGFWRNFDLWGVENNLNLKRQAHHFHGVQSLNGAFRLLRSGLFHVYSSVRLSTTWVGCGMNRAAHPAPT